jgi:hypothetical protein
MFDFCRAALAGIVCLASVGVSRGGEPIEVVAPRGSKMETNLEQTLPGETKDFENLGPHAPHPFRFSAPSPALTLPPPQQPANPLTEREKELLDLRKNWVFMTPDDVVGQAESDLSGGILGKDKDGSDKKASTAMERYFQRLYDSDRQTATNQVGKLDSSDSWTGPTNSVVGNNPGSSDGGAFGATPDYGIFRPARENTVSDIFGTSRDAGQPSPETVRLQEAQKEHMESFKQLWNIDQPAATPAPVSAAVRAPISPTPVFGAPAGDQPAINAFNSSFGGLSGQASGTAPIVPTITSSRSIVPPHSNFAPPQREF